MIDAGIWGSWWNANTLMTVRSSQEPISGGINAVRVERLERTTGLR